MNFSDVSHENYQVGVPFHGKYKEIFNTDRKEYGGNGLVNPRAKTSRSEECDERENSLKLRVPAFGAVILSCTLTEQAEKKPLKAPATKKRTAKKTDKKTKPEKKLAASAASSKSASPKKAAV